MQFLYEGTLEEFKFSVVKAFADYAQVPEAIAEKTLQKMSLTDYAGFVSALDSGNDKIITQIVDKYIENDDEEILGETITSLNEKKILSRFSIMEENSKMAGLPRIYSNAYNQISRLTEQQVKDYLGVWLINEDKEFRQIRDIAVHKFIYENTINPQLKNNVARLANKSSAQVKAPSFTDDKDQTKKEIVSADPQKNIIATKDEKGEIEVVQLDPQKKKQIALEDMKRLAGIKWKL